MKYELKKLSPEDGAEIYEMLQEMPEDENGFMNSVFGRSFEEYKEWLKGSAEDAEGTEVVDGWKVPQTTYWLYADGKPVGCGKIRHFLTEKLLQDGGNIGYGIRPSARGKGHGKVILSLLLKEAAALGMDKALVTIHEGNDASLKVALGNKGRLEKEADGLCYIWCETA